MMAVRNKRACDQDQPDKEVVNLQRLSGRSADLERNVKTVEGPF
jgi:hypothetical protein